MDSARACLNHVWKKLTLCNQVVQPAEGRLETVSTLISDPSPAQLEAFFALEPRVLEIIATCRYPHLTLGLALQLSTLRFL